MKKALFLLFAIILGVFAGCSNNPETIEHDVAVGTYVMESSDALKPYVVLKDNNEFSFTYSIYSSYWAIGSYEENDGGLILKTMDGDFEYVFEIDEKDLIFNAKESSELPSYANITDGTIFGFNEDYLDEREPFIGIGYNLEYKDKIFPDMTDLEIQVVIGKISSAAAEKAKKGEKFKVTKEELEELQITGLDPRYLDMIKISTE
ncbi:MAG: hypothetical protein RBR71_11060 [Gudongella sp.]|nr:hypothetical protein [Gudongella sp.]